MAAAEQPVLIRAVVSRGGRPDLAGPALARVKAPTLLIVGGDDYPVIEMNRSAYEQLGAEKRLDIVPGATHLFEVTGNSGAGCGSGAGMVQAVSGELMRHRGICASAALLTFATMFTCGSTTSAIS